MCFSITDIMARESKTIRRFACGISLIAISMFQASLAEDESDAQQKPCSYYESKLRELREQSTMEDVIAIFDGEGYLSPHFTSGHEFDSCVFGVTYVLSDEQAAKIKAGDESYTIKDKDLPVFFIFIEGNDEMVVIWPDHFVGTNIDDLYDAHYSKSTAVFDNL